MNDNSLKHRLTTERLDLLPFEAHEAELFHTLNTDPFIRKFMWDNEAIEMAAAREIIAQNQQHFEKDRFGIWKIRAKGSDEVMGYAGLWFFFDEPQPQLIYAILEKFTKQGFATEASKALRDYAFSELDFSYLIAATDEAHLESQKVTMRLGMSYVETRIENDKQTLFFRVDR